MHELHIDGCDARLAVARFVGVESLSELFHFEVTAVADDTGLDLPALVGKPARLVLGGGDGDRTVLGIVRRVEQGAVGKASTSYTFSLAPDAYRLTLRRDHRVFQHLSVPDVVADVLDRGGVAHRSALQGSYPAREYCVQYGETDWDFVSRLLEEEGIHCYFDCQHGKCELVLADAPSCHTAVHAPEAIVFRPPSGALRSGDHFSLFHYAEEVRSGAATLRDYNFEKPHLLVEGKHKGPREAELEVYDYPGGHDSPARGAELATVRFEEADAVRKTASGETTCRRLLPGFTFELTEHPSEDLNGKYLVTRVRSRGHDAQMFAGAEGDPFGCEVDVIPADRQHRPARVTPKPRIYGIQTAIVVGAAGEEVHTDEHGRIRVQFHWDRKGARNDKSSCWLRVAQPWAGPAFGAVFLPRVGHEVVVSFLEGDPDRPLVTGSVYHGSNVPPYALPAEKVTSGLKTQSSPGGGGYNELRFEDRAGSELVHFRAEKDHTVEVLHDRTEKVGHDESVTVGSNRSLTVAMNDRETVGIDRTVTVGANHTEIVGANLLVTVGANLTFTGSGGMSFDLGGWLKQHVTEDANIRMDQNVDEAVGKSRTEQVGEDMKLGVGGSYGLGVDKDASIDVGGDASESVGKNKTVKVGEQIVLECGDARITVQKSGDVLIEAKSLKVKATGPVQIEGDKLDVKTDGNVTVKAGGNVKVSGNNVDLN